MPFECQVRMFIPDYSRLSNIFITILLTQLLACVYWLLADETLSLASLGLWALFAHWVVLLTFTLIHLSRKLILSLNNWLSYSLVLFIALVSLIIVESGAHYYQSAGTQWWPTGNHFYRMCLAYAILILVIMRALHFVGHVNKLDRAESASRIAALQARIQPHFLFNSLNTIAELTATSPSQAESAIESLSMLFRVSLEDGKNRHSLQKEMNLCQRYCELESYRFEGDFDIDWSVSVEHTERWLVPKLLLQPMIENAIKYSPKDSGASTQILVSIKESSSSLSFKVDNSVSLDSKIASGHGIALQNIKDRLSALYDDKQSIKSTVRDGRYQILIQLPKQS